MDKILNDTNISYVPRKDEWFMVRLKDKNDKSWRTYFFKCIFSDEYMCIGKCKQYEEIVFLIEDCFFRKLDNEFVNSFCKEE